MSPSGLPEVCSGCVHLVDHPRKTIVLFKWCDLHKQPSAPGFDACAEKEEADVDSSRP